MYLIILSDEMKLVGKFKTLEQATIASELDYVDVATDCFPDGEAKQWARYGRLALLMLLRNHGVEGADMFQYVDMIKKAMRLADAIPADTRSLPALEAKAGPRPLPGDIRPIAPRSPYYQPVSEPCKGAPPSIKKQAPKLPGEARSAPQKGATGQVWEVADIQHAEWTSQGCTDIKVLRKAVIQACESLGINPGTAATQYGKWKGAKGL